MFTTGEAADALGVSGRYLTRLLNADRLPYRMAGDAQLIPPAAVRGSRWSVTAPFTSSTSWPRPRSGWASGEPSDGCVTGPLHRSHVVVAGVHSSSFCGIGEPGDEHPVRPEPVRCCARR